MLGTVDGLELRLNQYTRQCKTLFINNNWRINTIHADVVKPAVGRRVSTSGQSMCLLLVSPPVWVPFENTTKTLLIRSAVYLSWEYLM